jgi:hypothetical protein
MKKKFVWTISITITAAMLMFGTLISIYPETARGLTPQFKDSWGTIANNSATGNYTYQQQAEQIVTWWYMPQLLIIALFGLAPFPIISTYVLTKEEKEQ